MRPRAFLRLVLPFAAALTFPAAAVASQEEQGKAVSSPPRLDYRVDSHGDEQPSYNSDRHAYRGSGASEQAHDTPDDNSAAANATPASALPPGGPNPAYVGSGKVVNGWYYPPPQVTTTVTEYESTAGKR